MSTMVATPTSPVERLHTEPDPVHPERNTENHGPPEPAPTLTPTHTTNINANGDVGGDGDPGSISPTTLTDADTSTLDDASSALNAPSPLHDNDTNTTTTTPESDAETAKGDADADADADASDSEDDWSRIQKLPPIVEYKMMDFDQFKNRHGSEDGRSIIEVLRVGPSTRGKVSAEQSRRRRGRRRRTHAAGGSGGGGGGSAELNDTWIQRVRIQSQPIISHLQNVTGSNGWDVTRPRTFFRPFHTMVYFHDRMKESLRILEDRWAEAERRESVGEGGMKKDGETENYGEGDEEDDEEEDDDDDERSDIGEPKIDITGPDLNSVTALRHLRCYVGFVEKELIPLYERFNTTAVRKVLFSDLWMLFREGETLYCVSDSDESQSTSTSNPFSSSNSPSSTSSSTPMHQTAWRLYFIGDTIIKDHTPDDMGNEYSTFNAHCYHVDYDGNTYGAVKHIFKIKFFEGEKDITSLEIYPMRYAKDAESIRSHLIEQGNKFQSIINERHLLYKGWTITSTPTGEVEADFKTPEHIESDVIVDLVEGFQRYPSCKPEFYTTADEDDEWKFGEDDIHIRHWTDQRRVMLLGEVEEITVRGDCVVFRQINELLKTDPFLPESKSDKISRLADEDLMLLPRRMIAYVLRERKFVMVDIWSLQGVTAQANAFRDLKINPNHKRMVKALVQAHFKKQDLQKKRPLVGLSQDLITGKGSGLVILLHGAPGVGKTATAEAVAQANKKPLFVITCGDLGYSPKEVEEALNNIFRLAHLWNCVLLLDEADIFLSRRETTDLKRNALVSVFLRVLEYYSGILFLTTNRVGTLDEAFKSRIHVSLYYETLKKKQTLAIFQVNIDKLKAMETSKQEQLKDEEEFQEPLLTVDEKSILHYAAWYFDHVPDSRWNGRQIRNAFQIASSLARYDMRKTALDEWGEDETPSSQGPGQQQQQEEEEEAETVDVATGPVLDWWQFDMVAEAIERFETYMQEATGGTDVDAARIEHIRADDFDYQSTPPRPRYRPPRNPREWTQAARGGRARPIPPAPALRRGPGPGRGQPQPPSRADHAAPPGWRGGRQGPPPRRYQPPTSATVTPSRRAPRRMEMSPSGWDDGHGAPEEDQGMEEGYDDYYGGEEQYEEDY
ncbi:hypothetical protein BO70DRAFT_379229 [Aspergillus heteromorphus CBS 117.55]|uniref:AAA+ ATPase domain-containing protein n=1 Tax=Aspergillus heteromorphus CBS 117.55 TaxID=1448321 RepID=A0A317WDV2_9EURO|nr:uncharacterized protein BO70DRAFT_379229 [Aspergillus heteromorphus CBS 117.55]PWY83402.1 hypothetical protein BO70DRAFT_379229 [Aspergillus heteromorphus CBS 117.55]